MVLLSGPPHDQGECACVADSCDAGGASTAGLGELGDSGSDSVAGIQSGFPGSNRDSNDPAAVGVSDSRSVGGDGVCLAGVCAGMETASHRLSRCRDAGLDDLVGGCRLAE